MHFALRVALPDQPGVLGSLALALGRAGVNIVTLDVIEREEGIAVDDLRVETAGDAMEAVRKAAEVVPSAVVEAIRPIDRGGRGVSAMELAASVAKSHRDGALSCLVAGIPDAMWVSWCVALAAGSPPAVIAASPTAPSMNNVSTPWLPLEGPRRFAPSLWMPPAWCMGKMSYEVAAVPLRASDEALLVARKHGPRFRPSELRDLSFLVQIAEAHETDQVAAAVPRLHA